MTPQQETALAHVRRVLAEAAGAGMPRSFPEATARSVKYELILQQVADAFPEEATS